MHISWVSVSKSFVVPTCSGTFAARYSAITPSTTTSNGQGGNGIDVASGLAQNTGGCACSSLACESTTCTDQGWQSTTCNAMNNDCSATTTASAPLGTHLSVMDIIRIAIACAMVVANI